MPKRLSSEDIKKILEEKKGVEYEKIKKDTERKIYIVKNREKIIKYVKLGVIGIVAATFFLTFFIYLISDIFQVSPWKFLEKEEVVVQDVEEEEKPPEDFKVEIAEVKFIETEKKKVYDVLAKIKNQNTEWGVSELGYKFIFKDENDLVVGEKERKSYILPQQERYLMEIGIETLTAASSVELEINLLEVQKLEQFINPQTQFTKKGIDHFVDDNKSKVSGTLVNDSPFGFDQVDVYIILYDKNNKIKGMNFTNINSFLPDTERHFSVFWPEVLAKGDLTVEIDPNVNVFEAGNFMDIYGTGQVLEY